MAPSRFCLQLVLLGLGVVFWPAIAAHSAIVLTVKQDGNDVVVIGSGSAKTSGLFTSTPIPNYTNVLWFNQIYAGPNALENIPPPVAVNLWGAITGPSSISNDPLIIPTNPTSGFGDLFGVVADNGSGESLLVLPLNYMSGDSLNGTSRFSDSTLAGLGLSPGVFSWSWGTNPNADSFELRIEPVPPVPAPLPLAGVPIAWKLAKRMRRGSRDSPAKAAL